MFLAIQEKDLPKNLEEIKLGIGRIHTNSKLLLKGNNRFYKLYREPLPFYVVAELYELSKQDIPHAVFPESFIIDSNYQVTGEVQPFIKNSKTLTESAEIDTSSRKINQRIPKMYQLIRFVSSLNEHQFSHNDLHSDNFLEDEKRIYAIDLTQLKRGKEESTHQKHLNEILLSYLFGLTKKEGGELLGNSSYRLKESLRFAPKFLDFLFDGYQKSTEKVLDELYDHDKEATEVHITGKRL